MFVSGHGAVSQQNRVMSTPCRVPCRACLEEGTRGRRGCRGFRMEKHLCTSGEASGEFGAENKRIDKS